MKGIFFSNVLPTADDGTIHAIYIFEFEKSRAASSACLAGFSKRAALSRRFVFDNASLAVASW